MSMRMRHVDVSDSEIEEFDAMLAELPDYYDLDEVEYRSARNVNAVSTLARFMSAEITQWYMGSRPLTAFYYNNLLSRESMRDNRLQRKHFCATRTTERFAGWEAHATCWTDGKYGLDPFDILF